MRSTFWDSVKGAAIVAVVIIHASGPTLGAPPMSANWIGGLVLAQCADFAVPFFLAISGLFTRYDGNTPHRYYASRFRRLIGPYVAWSLIYIALGHMREFLQPEKVMEDITDGEGIGIGYFVPVLAQFVILTPLLARLRSERVHIALMITTAFVGLSYSYAVRLYLPDEMLGRFPWYALPFIVWCPFYQLGFYLARYPQRTEQLARHQRLLAGAMVLFLLLSIVEGFRLAGAGFVDLGASQLKITSFAFSAALFLWLAAEPKQSKMSYAAEPMAWLGQNSYPIYLMHMLVLRGFNLALSKVAVLDTHALALVPISAGIVLGLSCALIHAGQYMLRQPLRQALAL